MLGLLAGCSTSHYRQAADKEAYRIIDQAEQDVFGRPSPFSIDTQYSGRKPEDIPPEEIINARQQPGTLALTIEKSLTLAIQHSREYQTAKETYYLEALALSGARHDFRPIFGGGGSARYSRENGEWDLRSAEAGFDVGQALKSGGSLTLNLANDFLRFYTGDPSRTAVSTFSVNLIKPLLRGAGRDIVAERLTQAERSMIYATRTFSQYQREFKVGIVSSYFDLLQNKDRVINAWDDYQRRLETIQYTEARGQAGRQSQLDVDEARTEELTAKNTYIGAATTYLNEIDGFKLTLGLPLTTKIHLDDSPLKELEKLGVTSVFLDKDQALEFAIEKQLELLNQIDRYEDTKRKIKIAANQLKTDLTVRADASYQTDYTKFDIDDVNAGVGIGLDLPLDRLAERNNYRRSLIDFERAIRTLGRTLDEKKNEIDRGLRNLEALRRTYFIQTNSVAIAERRVEGEQLSLQAGRRTVRNVRDAQDVLRDSQNNLTSAIVDHLQAKLQLWLNIGILDTDIDKFWSRTDAVLVSLDDIQQPAAIRESSEEILPPDKILGL